MQIIDTLVSYVRSYYANMDLAWAVQYTEYKEYKEYVVERFTPNPSDNANEA